ncbi:ketoacyl-ACP synthase III [Paenibacillus doosanensis]|uniref:ketoacyl-ACP synthase III n=1 Tax=Paenibacillus doosanensis TaxID=1229154 RepID=UPI0021800268|nr:ketoacyl-ACP synthase III [Paenibacillus doosanensis]MCS7462546.1 ketoacyl-ACP synthase III [Paenibacillus doosanensis]
MRSKAKITAIGSYVPSKVLRNADLEMMMDTSDEWIVQRTGIRERRIAAKDEFTSHMCIGAIDDLINNYEVSIMDVDMILVATYTPDFPTPSVACLIQHHYGIPATGALDVNAACTGFVYAMNMANGLITSGLNRKILVVGADTASRIMDYSDRTSSILFGDGAGVVLMERTEDAGAFATQYFGSDGHGGSYLYRSGLRNELAGKKLASDGMLVQNGREVYRFAVGTVPQVIHTILDRLRLSADEIDWFIPHSANLRIVESISRKIGIPMSRTLHSMEYYGNTTAASIPLALSMGVKSGQVKTGDRLLLVGFGGGFTFGGMIVEWTLAIQAAVLPANENAMAQIGHPLGLPQSVST